MAALYLYDLNSHQGYLHMTESPIVTIGLPVYNSERHLEQSLKSLLAQTYQDFILIISDNASTDRTSQICSNSTQTLIHASVTTATKRT